ncbi:hypothetical protein ACH4S8_37915 [Streptomyces sp. NPDC021080]|uniref:hypothetical protein n=1 Tax=Streptomyces sp. NPDC021080 TaxID=3365110 RepID=UPI00379F22AE
MTVYDRLVLPYAEQKAQGLKPRGVCSGCGRDAALLADNTIRPHSEPKYGPYTGRTTTGKPCSGNRKRTRNLATLRVAAPLTEPEARLVREALGKALNDPALNFMYDRDGLDLLASALAKLADPANETETS